LAAARPSGLIVAEKCDDIPMTFENVYDLKHLTQVAEVDHIVSKGLAAQVCAQFRTWPSHLNRRIRKFAALSAKPLDKLKSDNTAAALLTDVSVNLTQISSDRRRVA
jgi:hypothetical protein